MELANIKELINDNYVAALMGFFASLITLWISQRLSNQDQEKNKHQNFFFKDESDYRRIMSWVLKEVEDVNSASFDKANSNLRKSVIEYFLLLSSQYFRYKQSLKQKNIIPGLEHQYETWEEHIRKNLDSAFFREAWEYAKTQLHISGEFSKVMDRLSLKEARKDENEPKV